MKYAENTKKQVPNKNMEYAEYTKNTEYTKNIGSTEYTKYTEKKTYIFYYPLNMRDQTNTQHRRIRRTYLFYCPVDVSDLWKHNTNMKYMSTPPELQYKAVISTQTRVAKAFVDVHYCNISICSNDLNLRLLLRHSNAEVKKWFSFLSQNLRKYSTPFFL